MLPLNFGEHVMSHCYDVPLRDQCLVSSFRRPRQTAQCGPTTSWRLHDASQLRPFGFSSGQEPFQGTGTWHRRCKRGWAENSVASECGMWECRGGGERKEVDESFREAGDDRGGPLSPPGLLSPTGLPAHRLPALRTLSDGTISRLTITTVIRGPRASSGRPVVQRPHLHVPRA